MKTACIAIFLLFGALLACKRQGAHPIATWGTASAQSSAAAPSAEADAAPPPVESVAATPPPATVPVAAPSAAPASSK